MLYNAIQPNIIKGSLGALMGALMVAFTFNCRCCFNVTFNQLHFMLTASTYSNLCLWFENINVIQNKFGLPESILRELLVNLVSGKMEQFGTCLHKYTKKGCGCYARVSRNESKWQ